MADWGMKVSEESYDIGTAGLQNLIASSNYSMFKIHSDGSQVGTIQAGQQAGTVTFTHGLGYVPAFIPYYRDTSGNLRILSGIREGIGIAGGVYAYAGTSTITCIYDLGYPHNYIQKTAWTDAVDTNGNFQLRVGNVDGAGKDCGVVYTNLNNGGQINLLQGDTIGTASLGFYVSSKGTNTANGTIRTFGINLDSITSISDLSSPLTSAVGTQTVANIGTGESFGINVKDQLQEVVNRAGFVGGTAGTASGVGFHIQNFDSPTNKFFIDSASLPDTTLTIVKPGSVTFAFRMVIFKDKVF